MGLPRWSGAALREREWQGDEADVVQLGAPRDVRQVQVGDDEHEARRNREEDSNRTASAREVVRDPTAGQRSRDRGDAEDGADISNVLTAPRGRVMMSPMVRERGMMVPIPKPCTAGRARPATRRLCRPARMDPSMKTTHPAK